MSNDQHDDDKTQSFIVLSEGTSVGHYRIIKKIGVGGMGEVYLAEDTQLDRKVALKFLSSHLSQDEAARARFTREAKAAAKLDHPNIVQVFEVGEFQGRPFFAMAHIEGKSLRELIKEDKLSINEAIEFTKQICEGLHEAHSAGIIHRDIKPGNIIINGKGKARILDFGLATVAGEDKLTKTGSTLGTIGYMSPEQVEGKLVDHRSDLFSVGVILYEILTGRRPFEGDTDAAVSHSITHSAPEPVARYKSGTTGELQRIIDKALQKNPALRYQHADGVLADLKRLSSMQGVSKTCKIAEHPNRIVVAVLPFENLGDAEDEYFADGVTEELITRLACLRGIGVIAQHSVDAYKRSGKTAAEVAEELGAEYVLEGTIRWQKRQDGSNHVRVAPRLITVSDGMYLWGENIETDIKDIFIVQSDIANRIVEVLNVELLDSERQSLARKPTTNMEAYYAYLRAQDLARSAVEDDNLQPQIDLLEKAVALDPVFAIAYTLLSIAHSRSYHFGDRTDACRLKALDAAEHALRLQPDLPEAHLALGLYHYWCFWDYEKADSELEIASAGLPNDARVLLALGSTSKRQGKFEEAIEIFRRALKLNPRDSALAGEIGICYQSLRQYEQAIEFYNHMISLQPDNRFGYEFKFQLYLWHIGDLTAARQALRDIPRSAGGPSSWSRYTLGVFERDYNSALRLSDTIPNPREGEFFGYPSVLREALTYKYMGAEQNANRAFDSASHILESLLLENSEDYRIHAALGTTYAALGIEELAIQHGQHAIELLPISKDAIDGPNLVENLARIHTFLGHRDMAIEKLEYLLSIPSYYFGVGELRLAPDWDPLRDHPRFQALIEKYEKEREI